MPRRASLAEVNEVGDYYWGTDNQGHRVLWLLVPDTVHGRRYQVLRLYMQSEKQNWAKPGPRNGWDGDEELPTLTPSIQARTKIHSDDDEDGIEVNAWHGFLEKGVLRTV